jgi:isopenicillin N synthase-like dioxygenase
VERKVPELSLFSYVKGSPSEQKDFVDKLWSGLKDYGFIILTDHTVDNNKVQDAYDMVHEFFQMPLEEKMKYIDANKGYQRGYTPYKQEHAKDSDVPDLKEFWHVGRSLTEGSQYYNEYPKNIWVDKIAGFKDTFEALYQSMDAASVVLLQAIGKAMDLPDSYFADMVNEGNSILRMIHYPPTAAETAGGVRAAAHEDINLITMLVGATDGGLELLDRDGTWLPVKTAPGQIIVDTGDMMSRITNEVLPATTHRVVNPQDTSSTRYSMPFFVHPHSNAMLSCIESCKGDGAKYEDITAGDFLIQRLKEIGLYKD